MGPSRNLEEVMIDKLSLDHRYVEDNCAHGGRYAASDEGNLHCIRCADPGIGYGDAGG